MMLTDEFFNSGNEGIIDVVHDYNINKFYFIIK